MSGNSLLIEHVILYKVSLTSTRAFKLLLDAYVFTIFWKTFAFFVNKKKELLLDKEMKFTATNKYVIASVLVLFLLNAYHSVMALVFTSLNFDYGRNELYLFLLSLENQFIVSLVDFLTMLGLLFLFSHMG
jgi:hypothetical protein